MSNVLVNETSLQNIASAIREKNGTAITYKPSEMASGISNIKYKPKTISFRQDSVNSDFDYETANLDTSLMTSMREAFNRLTKVKKLDLSGWDTSNVSTYQTMVAYCGRLEKIDASGFTAKQDALISSMINVASLTLLDMRNFDFTKATFTTNPFSIPSTCEIVVADSTQKEWFANRISSLTNVMTVAEYDAKCHIHLEYGDGESASNPKKYYYSIAVGDTTTLPDSTDITPPTDKVFDHWEDSEGNTVTSFTATTNNSVEFTAIYVDSE